MTAGPEFFLAFLIVVFAVVGIEVGGLGLFNLIFPHRWQHKRGRK